MKLRSIKKILSVTLSVLFLLQQGGFVFATTNVSTWSDLQSGIAGTPDEYNVTTALTADDSPDGTLNITANGYSVTGASLTENGTHDTLVNVANAITFGLGNNISGSIVNNGVLNYSGSSLANGTVTGNGTLNFNGATVTNANTINQSAVSVNAATTLTNNAAVTATTFTNNGYVFQNGLLTAAVSNVLGSTLEIDPDNLAGDVANAGTLRFNAGGALAQNITGNGLTRFDGSDEVALDDANSIAQDTIKVGSSATLTANASNLSATTEIFNDGQLNLTGGTNANAINGDGAVEFSGASVINNGAIDQQTGGVVNKADVLENNAMITAEITNNSGKELYSAADNLNGLIHNAGSLYLQGGTVANAIDGAGDLIIQTASLSNAYNITQANLTAEDDFINSGLVNLTSLDTVLGATVSNSNRITVTGEVNNVGTIENQAGATFNNNDSASSIINNSGTIDNYGTFNAYTINNSDTFNNSADLSFNDVTNTGTFYQDAGSMNISGTSATFDNQGSFILDGGDVYVASYTNSNSANTAVNAGTFNAETLQNNNAFYNAGTVNTFNFTNDGTVTGNGTINITDDSTNNGSITQGLVTIDNFSTFTNNGMLAANVSNANGSNLDSDPDNLGGDVANEGILNLNAAGTLSINVTGAGETNIQGDLDNQGSIAQADINIDSGVVVTTNASNMTATNNIANEGVINYTGGTTGNTITGSGRVDVTGYVTNTGDITQTTVSNTGVFTNNGTVTANLNNSHDIEGTGSIETGTGISSNTGNITQDALTNNGTFDNSGHVTLNNLTNSTNSTFNTNGDLLAVANGVANEGTLNITGGTNANAITGAGVTNFTNDVTNTGSISQTTVTNSGNLTNNGTITAAVSNTGTLTSNGEDITGNINNSGSYVITNGGNVNIITGTGTTTIYGNTDNTGSITQENLIIGNSANFTTSSEMVNAAISNEGTMTWSGGSTNGNVVSGNGSLIVGSDIVNSASISQGNITISSGSLTSNADLLTSANGITNNAGLTLTGGTNNNAISGNGSLVTTGDVTNNAAIDQASITVNAGNLTTDASLLTTANGITNNDGLTLTGGTNNNDISGTGLTYIDGTVTNEYGADITTDIQVTATGNYSTLNDIVSTVENRNIVQIIDADITSTGKIEGSGTTNILGETTNSGTIEGTAVNITAGSTLHSNSDNIEAAITNDGTYEITAGYGNANVISGSGNLEINGGTVANTAAISQGNITITSGSLESNADLLTTTSGIDNAADLILTGGTNNNVINGNGNLAIDGDVTNNAAINQYSVNVSNGQLTTDASLLTATNGVDLASNTGLSLTGGTNTNAISGNGTTYINGNVENTGTIDTNIGVGTSGHYATTTEIKKDLENNGITDITNANISSSTVITGSGTTNILGTTVNNGEITQGNLNIASTGNFTTDIDDVSAAIANEGSMTWNAGSANGNVVTGNGSLEITGGNITNSASITQGNITIANGAYLTSNADLLASANGIANSGDLILNGGTNNNVISGNGDLEIAGDVTNNAAISQDTVLVTAGQLTTDASLLTATSGVTNEAAISLTGGINTNSISGNGTTYIDGTVENTGTIDTNIGVGTSGHYATESDITKALANNGITDITDANVNAAITGTGTTNILGTTTNNSTITQGNLNIASTGDFTTNIEDVSAAIANEGSMTWDGGSANSNVVTGSGSLIIDGATVDNSASINQGNITISSGSLSSNADLLVSANGITNNVADGLVLTGGTNNNAISGTGALVVDGDVTNNAAINQESITVDSGNLTTDASLLTTSNGIVNYAGLTLTGGENDDDISGSGMTYIDGTVTNGADITTDIQVNATGNYATLTDVVSTVENRNIVQLVDADIASTGKIKGSGTTNILGETTNSGTIEGSVVNITAGSILHSNSEKIEAAITNDGTYEITAGTANENVISGSGNLEINGGTVTNTAAISQGNITISSGSLTSNADLLTSVGGIANNADLILDGGTNNNVVTGTGDIEFTGTTTNNASVTQATITNSGDLTNNAAMTGAVTNTSNLTNNALITGDVTNSGTLTSNGTNIAGDIDNTGSYVITDGDNANDITGATGTVTIQGNTTNTGVINQDSISIANGATFVASTMDDIATANGIDNAGTFEMQGGTNNNAISGTTGSLKVTGAVTNTQNKLIVQDNIDIATLGSLVAYADDLNTVNGITNSGALTLNDGTTNNNISGNGTLAVIGTVNNGGNISQTSLDNSGTFTSDASLLAFADGITNSATLNLTGGTNENAITGAGDTNFTNDVVNNGTIAQTNVTNAAGTLTNNADITAAFTNDSGTVNNEAVITGTITNNSGTINSTADNLAGAVTNNGTLNVAGGTVQNVISGTGDMNITADLTNDKIIAQGNVTNSANFTNSGLITVDNDFTNSGVVDNSATITGNIINSGEINSSADHLVGDIANDGELNLSGGTSTHGDITGNGDTNITGDLSVNNTINQANVTNTANLQVNSTITADDITNSGVITGKASDLVASNEIANEGTLVFNAASTGASVISGAGDVQVTADTTLTANNTYTGETLIDGATLTIAGQNQIDAASDILFANDGVLQVTAAGSLDNLLKGQAAADNVRVQNDADLTLNTAMGESADFHKTGVGVMTFAMASNGYSGNTYVDGGTLIGNTLNINNTVNGAAGTTVEFTDTADAELNAINTLGTFVKSGSALFNVEANAFSAAQADINSGIFAANRDITATVLNVNNGATLRGNGNITGTVNVNNGGTIAPGNSIDTLTITGDVNFAAGSTTAIEINETPASDLLVITGNANIDSGANLTVSNENGRYFEWESFEIVNAGNVTGEFTYDGTITDYDASRINVEVDYSDPTKVLLVAKRKATDYETTTDGLAHNQREASKAIDAVSTGFGGDITNALLQLEALGGLNPDEVTLINPDATLKTALADVAGTLYANNSLATLLNAKTAHVYDRIAKRNPSKGACPNCHDNVWAEYYNQYDKVYSDSNSSRYTNHMSGVLVGYDRSSEDVLLGVYGGFGKSYLRQNDHSQMDLDDTTLGVYGGYRTGDWLFKGTLLGGVQHYNTKRDIRFMGRRANGSYDGVSLALDLEGSYSIPVYSWLTVRPFVGWLNNYSHQNAFTESGADALNLHVFGHDQFNSQVRLGVQLEGKVKNRLSWYGSAAVKQFIGDDYARMNMKLENLPDTNMDIISAKLGGTYFSGQAGLNYAITDNWSIFGNLDTGLSNKSTNCYGNIGVAYTW